MNLVFMIFFRGIFIITWLFRGALSLPFLCPLVVTHCYLFPSCGCFGRLCWLYCSSARLLRLYSCVAVASVAFVGCTVLPHAPPFITLRCGCFGRLCWLNCPSTRFSHCFCVVVVSVAFVGCTVLPHLFSFFLFFVRYGCSGRLCWLYCSSARSSRCIAPLFRLLAFLPRLSLSILSFVLIW